MSNATAVCDEVSQEDAAIQAAAVALLDPPHCKDDCRCQCGQSLCGCHDFEAMSWRSKEAEKVPVSEELENEALRRGGVV